MFENQYEYAQNVQLDNNNPLKLYLISIVVTDYTKF